MDLVNLPDETERAILKLDRADLRKELNTGWGATTGGQALTKRYHERLTEGFRLALLDAHKGMRSEAELIVLLRGLPPNLIALSCLQTILHSIGNREVLRDTLETLGLAIANECWAAELTVRNSALAARLARDAKVKHGRTTRRYSAVKRAVDRAKTFKHDPKKSEASNAARKETAQTLVGFKERTWSRESLLIAGAWLYNVAASSLSEVFERVTLHGTTEHMITIRPEAWAVVDEALQRHVDQNPAYWPSQEAPKPWEAYEGGGSHDERVNAYTTVLRTNSRETVAAVKHAIKTGTMKPALDALNALQAVPFSINTQVLAVIKELDGFGIHVEGLVPPDLVVNEKLNAFQRETMEDGQCRFWSLKRAEQIKTNAGYIGDRILFKMDMDVADAMAQHGRFYTPMNLDWRGRVYALCSFNFQREDRVRALFLFADGLPIGDEGLRYLKRHTANCFDFKVDVAGATDKVKISKRPLEEREHWCDQNKEMITNIASGPLVHTEWMQAGEPFLALAASFELAAAWAQGSSYVTRLPTSYDGSCSGLQHLSGMTRASEGVMVNLTSSPLPADVYQTIADDAYAAITLDLLHDPDPEADDAEVAAKASKDIRAIAQLLLDYSGDRRTIAKRNVMTYSYSSRKFGMSAQQQVDLMEPLARQVLEGSLEEHPFAGYCHGPYNKEGVQQPSKAARYLAGKIFDAIEARIKMPARAMKFLQDIAKAMAHEGKPVRWTTPAGIPWINRYHPREMTSVNLYLNDGGLKERVRMNVATGFKKEIDKAKSANGVAPNFVHALDGSALLLATNAAAAEGITSMATVHDSFGCLAPQAARYNEVIREEFVRMYETNDVLAQILEQAKCDLTHANWHRLPDPIEYGPLNLKDILDAQYAFA